MRYLTGTENTQAENYMQQAAEIARQATCGRRKCGSVIVQNSEIIGKWYNSPPADKPEQRRCDIHKDQYDKKVTDKTCCVHAEQRAIMDALRHHANQIIWSTLYFIRIDQDWNIKHSKQPYCTICSKMALDIGIKEFVLWQEDGIRAYETGEYNTLSFNYRP